MFATLSTLAALQLVSPGLYRTTTFAVRAEVIDRCQVSPIQIRCARGRPVVVRRWDGQSLIVEF